MILLHFSNYMGGFGVVEYEVYRMYFRE